MDVEGDGTLRISGFARLASERIGEDLRRTTEHTLVLSGRPHEDNEDMTVIDILFDGADTGGVGIFLGSDEEASIAELADLLRETTLDEAVWGGWPTCARHHTHPLEPVVREDVAVWLCPTDAVVVARIGDLHQIGGRRS